MNLLAHCLLSLPDEEVLLGNFMGDFVKGRKWQSYNPGIQKGILLHRFIDGFTDDHALVRQAVGRMRPAAGRYAAPLTDILFDHLISIHWEKIEDADKEQTLAYFYRVLGENLEVFPEVLRRRLPAMLDDRFLHRYGEMEGMRMVLNRFNRRLGGALPVDAVLAQFAGDLPFFTEVILEFYPLLRQEAALYKSEA